MRVFLRSLTVNDISFILSRTCDFGINTVSFITGPFSGAFAQFSKAAVSFIVYVCSSFRPRGMTRLPMGEFSLNYTFEYFSKIRRKKVLVFFKI